MMYYYTDLDTKDINYRCMISIQALDIHKKIIKGENLIGFIELNPFIPIQNNRQKFSFGLGLQARFGEHKVRRQLETFMTYSVQEFPQMKAVKKLFPGNFIMTWQDQLPGLNFRKLPKSQVAEVKWFALKESAFLQIEGIVIDFKGFRSLKDFESTIIQQAKQIQK